MVVLIGLGDPKKLVSRCPAVLLSFLCSALHFRVTSGTSTVSCRKGKNIISFIFILNQRGTKVFKNPTGILTKRVMLFTKCFSEEGTLLCASVKMFMCHMRWMELGWGTGQMTLLERLSVPPGSWPRRSSGGAALLEKYNSFAWPPGELWGSVRALRGWLFSLWYLPGWTLFGIALFPRIQALRWDELGGLKRRQCRGGERSLHQRRLPWRWMFGEYSKMK